MTLRTAINPENYFELLDYFLFTVLSLKLALWLLCQHL